MFLLEPADILLELIIKGIILAVLTERYVSAFLEHDDDILMDVHQIHSQNSFFHLLFTHRIHCICLPF